VRIIAVAPLVALLVSVCPLSFESVSGVAFASTGGGTCPSDMVLVSGERCEEPVQTCKRWLDPPGPYHHLRCAEYAPTVCTGNKARVRVCIDKDEYTADGETLPTVQVTFPEAQALCEKKGRRLCTEHEWEFACEGEAALPYPHGLVRENACNIDRTDLGTPNDGLKDWRSPKDAFPRCVSPFGVHNMTGNVDEWVVDEGTQAPRRSVLRGGWWLPGRNRCRAATRGHDETYRGKQVGFRCCANAP
jgi:formylglycine-generating enzyme required for sulfatase activity